MEKDQKNDEMEMLNLMPESKVRFLKDMLEKEHRTDQDWDRISDVLFAYNLVSLAVPQKEGLIRSVYGVLCVSDELIAFTNMADFSYYYYALKKAAPYLEDIKLVCCSFQDLMDLSDDEEMLLLIDPKPAWEGQDEKIITYDPFEQRTNASLTRNTECFPGDKTSRADTMKTLLFLSTIKNGLEKLTGQGEKGGKAPKDQE